jgi:YD repeat-containing protein
LNIFIDPLEVNGIKGLVKKVTDPLGNYVQYTYDAHGNVATMTDELGHVTTYTRNELGWLLSETSQEGRVTVYEYNALGNLLRTIKDDGQIVDRKEYNELGQLIKEVSPNEYDATKDTAEGYTDDVGTRYLYNPAGRVIQKKDSLDNITSYTYDELGRIETEISPNGLTYIYEYDEIGRKIRTSYELPDTTTQVLEEVIYTLNNGQLTVVPSIGLTTFSNVIPSAA